MRARVVGSVVAVVAVAASLFVVLPTARGAVEDDIASALLGAINDGRAAVGLDAVEEWSVISNIATKHSIRQGRRGQISHRGFPKRAARIRAAGSGVNGICENVAFVSGTTNAEEIVRTFYRGWDNSPPHHACLFDEDFKTTWAGVGIARVGSSTWYATYIGAQDASPGTP